MMTRLLNNVVKGYDGYDGPGSPTHLPLESESGNLARLYLAQVGLPRIRLAHRFMAAEARRL